MRAEVSPEDVEFLVIGDDGPIDGDLLLEDRVFDEAAEFAQQVQPLADRRGVTGGLDIDVGPIPAGHLLDLRDGVLLGEVDGHVSSAGLGQLELLGHHVQGDDAQRVLLPGASDGGEADGACPGNDDRVAELDLGPLDGVHGAGERLRERSVLARKLRRHTVSQSARRDEDVFRHRAVEALEAEHVVDFAHPVPAALTVEAFPARHDLLAGDPVAQRDTAGVQRAVAGCHDGADELMAGDAIPLSPGLLVLSAPELLRTVIALQVGGADADGVRPQEQLTGPGRGHRAVFDAVVLRTVDDDGAHRIRDGMRGRCFGRHDGWPP